jgi:hypothetical protein
LNKKKDTLIMTVVHVRWLVPMGGAIMRDLTFLLHFLRQGKKWKTIVARIKSL